LPADLLCQSLLLLLDQQSLPSLPCISQPCCGQALCGEALLLLL
jgi:hypothetical protein